MDELDKSLDLCIERVTTYYLGEQEAQPQQPPMQAPPVAAAQPQEYQEKPPAQGEQDVQAPTGVGIDQTGQPDPMGAMGIPGPAYAEPVDPEIKELDIDQVAPDPDKITPSPIVYNG